MDAEILKTFINDAGDSLPIMRAGIIAYEQDALRLAELQTSRRQAHLIKGSALMLNQPQIGETAAEIESYLKTIIQTKSALAENQTSELLSKILILESHLKDLQEKIDFLVPESENILNFPLETSQPFEIETAENLSDTSQTEDFEIDQETLEVFALEAEDLLRNIGSNLTILEKSPNQREALLEIRRSAHTLKGSAGIIGLKKLSDLAHRVEDLLDFLSENEVSGSSRIFELLQTAFDCLSALANNENSQQLEQNIEFVYHNFDEILALLKVEKELPLFTTEKTEIAIQKQADQNIPVIETEKTEPEPAENSAPETINPNRSVVRVSLDRLNDLFNLVGEMVITRSVFEQRLSDFEQQIRELHRTTRRLRASTDKLEIDLDSSTNSIPSQSSNSSFLFNSSSLDFDNLEFDRYTNLHQTTRELIEAASDTSAINSGMNDLSEKFNLLFDNQRRLIEEMQENLLRLRMVSLNSLAPRLQRTIRVTAQEEGKHAEFVIENETLEIDAEILDAVVEPLLHLLRNAVAHGIETPDSRRTMGKPEKGRITLRAFSEGTHVVFVVSDDGCGISAAGLKEKAVRAGFISQNEVNNLSDEESYSLVFLPGLSTSRQVNQVSGRGVGMNIVKTAVSRRHGTVSVKSEAQKGTSFTIRLPVSLAVTRALLAKSANRTYALPMDLVKQVIEISPGEFNKAVQNKVLKAGDISYPFYHFNDLLGFTHSASAVSSAAVQVLLLKIPDNPCALAIDQVVKTDEIIIKPLGALFNNINEITGATILGDGSVVPVLDLTYLLENQVSNKQKVSRQTESKKEISKPAFKVLTVLIVDDSPSVRQVNSKLIKKAGWNALIAKDGVEALEVLQAAGEKLPDVILTDVEMPRMDGYELLATLKKQPVLRRIPVIMITSRAGEKHRRRAFDLGVDEYLSKPYEDAALLEQISALTTSS